jgi:hypothetical protein
MRTEALQQSRDVSSTTLTHELSFEEIQELPPDGGYGWVCVACCFTINAFTWGVLSVCHLPYNSPFSSLTLPVIRRLPSLLPPKQHLPRRHLLRLRAYRRSQLLHGYDRLPARYSANSSLRSTPPHGLRYHLPNLRLHIRLLRPPHLATLPLPRSSRWFWHRFDLDPEYRGAAAVVPETEEHGEWDLLCWVWDWRTDVLVCCEGYFE